MLYILEAEEDTQLDAFADEVTITGQLFGTQTSKQYELLLENAQAFDEAVNTGIIDEETAKLLKGK